jgi:hypothetical protein
VSRVLSFAEAAKLVGIESGEAKDRGQRLRRLVRKRELELGRELVVPIGETGKRKGITMATLRRYMPRLFDTPNELRREFLGHMREVNERITNCDNRIDDLECKLGITIEALNRHEPA